MMPAYRVIEPCAYTDADVSVHHREPGSVVEISEETARKLGKAVQPMGSGAQLTEVPELEPVSETELPPVSDAEPEPEPTTRGRGRRGSAESAENGDE